MVLEVKWYFWQKGGLVNMKEATITRITGKVDWSIIPVITIDELIKTEKTNVKAYGQIAYDDQKLYLHLYSKEDEIRRECLVIPTTEEWKYIFIWICRKMMWYST